MIRHSTTGSAIMTTLGTHDGGGNARFRRPECQLAALQQHAEANGWIRQGPPELVQLDLEPRGSMMDVSR
jgi:hypothetical protein